MKSRRRNEAEDTSENICAGFGAEALGNLLLDPCAADCPFSGIVGTVDNLIALAKLFGVPVESIIAVKAVAVKGRELIFVFRGKVSWVVCETDDYAAI